MRSLVVGLCVCATVLLGATGVLGQSEFLLVDQFELLAPVVGEWNHWDLYGNTSNLGVLPEVIYDAGASTNILHFDSTDSWRQRQGAYYIPPALSGDDIMVFELDFMRNTADTQFTIEPGRKQPNLINGRFGAVTSDYQTVWSLPFMSYKSGIAYEGGSSYLFEGIRVLVPIHRIHPTASMPIDTTFP